MISQVQAGDRLATPRALGALLCVMTVVVAVAHIWFGYIIPWRGNGTRPSLAFALPITVGLLVVLGLGFWLGWIMASTKEVSPTITTTPEAKSTEQSPRKKKRKK